MASLISKYVKQQEKKLARDKADRNVHLTRITWENAHRFFNRENEFPAPGVCEICPVNSKTGRHPDLPNVYVAERHLNGGDHLAALGKRAERLQSVNSRANYSSGGGSRARRKFTPCPLFDCQGKAQYSDGDKWARCNVCNSKVVVPE